MTTLVVVSHSDPDSLTHHVAQSVSDAIRAAGDTVETADLAAENFDPRFSSADLNLFRGNGTTPVDVLAEQERIDRADHLVLVFPMYWWSMPALLKGWIDRVFVSGWAHDITADSGVVKKLDRLTVHLIPIAGDDADSFEIVSVPADSPVVALLTLSGLMMKADWVMPGATDPAPAKGSEEKK